MLNFPYKTGGIALSKVLKLTLTGGYIAKYIHLQYMHVCIWMMADDSGLQHVELGEKDPPSFIDKSYAAAAAAAVHDGGVGCSSGSL